MSDSMRQASAKHQENKHQEEIILPALIWQRKHALGELVHVVRSERSEIIVKRVSVSVSPRIKQQLLLLKSGERIILTTRRNCPVPEGVDGVLYQQRDEIASWQYHRELTGRNDSARWTEMKSRASHSWRCGIRYTSEVFDEKGNVAVQGLRAPQIGALHAIGAHWSLYNSPATIVMPTGTGKTETMIATLVSEVKGTLLVIVPSKALRDQTAKKFLTLGLLRSLQVISEDLLNPIVGIVNKRPKSTDDLDILESCHVVVSTMAAVSQDTALSLVPEMVSRTACLIVDEAHHVGAKSWAAFRDHFTRVRVLQFTATPFRRDGVLVDGDVIYSYPLRRAQEDQYFKQINFNPVCEIGTATADRAIAQKAVSQLQTDLDTGFDHLVMARCNSIERAEELLALYQLLGPQYQPILVHSKDPASSQYLESLHNRVSRIVVCVEMLGEGFDLPHLKIAAIHDTHKSLAVLLQFTGRFTRVAGDKIGDATVIANIADQDVSVGLERLYSEDADWNLLLAEFSSEAAREHQQLVDFLRDSVSLDDMGGDSLTLISSALLRPKFSTVVYKVTEFQPRRFHRAIPASTEVHCVWLHTRMNTLYYHYKE